MTSSNRTRDTEVRYVTFRMCLLSELQLDTDFPFQSNAQGQVVLKTAQVYVPLVTLDGQCCRGSPVRQDHGWQAEPSRPCVACDDGPGRSKVAETF